MNSRLMKVLNRRATLRAAAVLGSIAASNAALAVDQRDLSAVRGDASRDLMGDGSGVRIGILDSGIDANHPAIRGTIIGARDFSRSGTVDDEKRGVGHATGIAAIYTGLDGGGYTGLAPGAGVLNARVITPNDYTTDRYATEGLMWSLQNKAKVINMSFGNKLGDGPLSNQFNLIIDYVTRRFGASVVSAAGNEDDTAVNQTPAGAYNGWSIGALKPSRFDQVASFSNYALSKDRRSKPDIVAPGQSIMRAVSNWESGADYYVGSGTSFATPIVGGVLAQMIGYGQSRRLSTEPALLKAIIMTGAQKVWDFDGAPWSARDSFPDARDGRVYDQPLDDEQGAGRVDAVSAYRIYSKTHDSDNAVTGWKLGRMRKGNTYTIKLGELSPGQRVDSTIAWYRQVAVKDNGNRKVDVGDKFYEAAALADFALTLLRDGRPVATSDSNFDNVEHLSFRIVEEGEYSVRALRYVEGGLKRELFGMAARVLNNAPIQRQLEDGVSQSFAEFGGVSRGLEMGVSQVPEPSGLLAVAGGMVVLGRRRRRRRTMSAQHRSSRRRSPPTRAGSPCHQSP